MNPVLSRLLLFLIRASHAFLNVADQYGHPKEEIADARRHLAGLFRHCRKNRKP